MVFEVTLNDIFCKFIVFIITFVLTGIVHPKNAIIKTLKNIF